MACIEKIYSVSALVGSGACNGNCSFCAGKHLREQAANPLTHGAWRRNLEAAIKLSSRYGGWSLSLTGSGEPTCDPADVTEALEIYAACAKQGAFFPNVNLFTNGILFGDKEFADQWLPLWKSFGLTNVAVSIHAASQHGQARTYGLRSYPFFSDIFGNICRHVGLRCTLLLQRGKIDNAKAYEDAVCFLRDAGCGNITSWPIGNPDGTRNDFTPSRLGLMGIRQWLRQNAKFCHGHVWGGGVYDWYGSILRIMDYVSKHDPKADFVRQLVVFQDGTVAYSWIREGALCMK